jgi:hypothetical protein
MSALGKRYTLQPRIGGPIAVSSWCPVCEDQSVEVYQLPIIDMMFRFAATCHGSIERAQCLYVDLMLARPNELAPCLDKWLSLVFKDDLQPDIMLAIRYSQGRTMKEPR